MAGIPMDDLQHAGLVATEPGPRLTEKGRDWLRVLEDVETQEMSDIVSSEELILSTSGLFR